MKKKYIRLQIRIIGDIFYDSRKTKDGVAELLLKGISSFVYPDGKTTEVESIDIPGFILKRKKGE